VSRGQIVLNRPIKALGIYQTRVALHPEVSVNVTVNVARTDEEAKLQLERGGAITSADEMEAAEAAETALAIADDAEAEATAAEGLVEEEVAERLTSDAVEEDFTAESEAKPSESGSNGDDSTP
jgi:large subunit ribosomal protein L9